MLIEKIENNLKELLKNIKKENFIFSFLEAYDLPKATISRLQKGDYNLSKNSNELIWKKKIAFIPIDKDKQDSHVTIDELFKSELPIKYDLRFLIVTNFEEFLAIDLKSKQSLDIRINDLHKHVDFFLPLSGLEKNEMLSESPADIKAAEKIGRLYDVILEDNILLFKSEKSQHDLNIFLTRLLFCFFAEDSEIFLKDQFTNSIASHTLEDGSDLEEYLKKLFLVLNIKDRKSYPKYLSDFPYVNGGLFSEECKLPRFSKKVRKIIIECGSLDWSQINPDIFGSMMQAIVSHNKREDLGMHYTSSVNILKLIKPLFLNDLYEELSIANDQKKLKKLLNRLYNIKIFDPACGSGNFLIVAFKELCKLEIKVYQKLNSFTETDFLLWKSGIRLNQFFGIDVDNYACETAKLSLWLSEHQMNMIFKNIFGETKPTLPLSESGNIFNTNSNQIDWNKVCKINKDDEVYVIGNPPYLGARNQSINHKKDLEICFEGNLNYKDCDYISCWFLNGVKYIFNNNAKLAFVATSSISQGEQVNYLWSILLKTCEINFAFKPFKWTNNAKGQATIYCVIISLRNFSKNKKILFYKDDYLEEVNNISPYLIKGKNILVKRSLNNISGYSEMVGGSMPRDGGHLILSDLEKTQACEKYVNLNKFIRPLIGADEFLYSKRRWCLWIEDNQLTEAKEVPEIKTRIDKVYEFRKNSVAKTTIQYSSVPHRFAQRVIPKSDFFLIPRTSSERRIYIPIGFFDKNYIVTDSVNIIFDPDICLFGILSSKLHMIWVHLVSGRLGETIRYSKEITYNTFPIPELNSKQKENIKSASLNILDVREKYSDKHLAELYNPESMPFLLLNAHVQLDEIIEKIYFNKILNSEDDRINSLLEMYEKKEQILNLS